MHTAGPAPAGRWRPMRPADLGCVAAIAATVHPAYPEKTEIFAERLRLYPPGCLILEADRSPRGYAISHPWHAGGPPKLDRCLGQIPAQPALFYLHDIAVLPSLRGCGFGTMLVDHLVQVAIQAGLPAMALVAVAGTAPFWRQSGFEPVDDPATRAALASYGDSARFMLRALPASMA
jgi:ribosomal protein S18 acetylase RimI-like enzyme